MAKEKPDTAGEAIYNFTVPEQAVRVVGPAVLVIQFIEREIAWYETKQPMLQGQFNYGGVGQADPQIATNAVKELKAIKGSLQRGDVAPLKAYEQDARRFRVVVGQGSLGKRIDEVAAGRSENGKWAFYLYSSKWTGDGIDRAIAPLRSVALSNPSLSVGGNISLVEKMSADTVDLATDMKAKMATFDRFLQEKSKLIGELEDLFRKKLPVEEPAAFWETRAQQKNRLWHVWLFAFAVLAITPIIIVLENWHIISPELSKLTSGGFSLGGLAVLTIPAVLYGWVLKNVSRVFVQQMNLADDASHRRALAITWLGLVAEKRFDLSNEERALVLNAMFRPVPPNAQDDGPPAGLLELVKGKQ